jgi:hypothetical protein
MGKCLMILSVLYMGCGGLGGSASGQDEWAQFYDYAVASPWVANSAPGFALTLTATPGTLRRGDVDRARTARYVDRRADRTGEEPLGLIQDVPRPRRAAPKLSDASAGATGRLPRALSSP